MSKTKARMAAIYRVNWEGLDAYFNDDAFYLFEAARADSEKGWEARKAIVAGMTQRGGIDVANSIIRIKREAAPDPNELYDMLDMMMAKLQELNLANSELAEMNAKLMTLADQQRHAIALLQGESPADITFN